MKIRLGLAITTAVLGASAAVFLLSQNPEVEISPAVSVADSALQIKPLVSAEIERQPLPPSLRGTSHGVRLVSRDGELLVTSALRDLFDYYLSATGELTLDNIRQWIEQELERQLGSGSALSEATNILQDYLDYKTQLQAFEQQYQPDPQATTEQQLAFFSERQQALQLLQNNILGHDVADIFFAFDRQMDDHTLAKAQILNSDLSEEGKQQALINLQAELPIQVQLHQQRNQQQAELAVIDQTQLNAADKFQQREAVVGAEAAQRLAELDTQRDEWQRRLDQFQQDVDLIKQSGSSGTDFSDAYQELLEQQFQPHEQVRAKALIRP